MGIALDLRDRKRLQEMQQLYETVVLHDLRSPLGALLGALDIIVDGHLGPLEESHRGLLDRARRQGRRLLEMIATSLDLEKLRRRKLTVERRPVDLLKVVGEVFETHEELAGRRRVALELRTGGRGATARDQIVWWLDRLHLQRCVDNLVKNAVEGSPPGSTVWASVDVDDGRAMLRVHNAGPPIPPDVRATLFHPFGTHGKRGGSGLGLYGVKLLVEAMAGEVSFETGEGGTTFELLFAREDGGIRL
jgi:signal transduction histidine kinase